MFLESSGAFFLYGKTSVWMAVEGGKHGSTGEGFRRKNGPQQDLLKFQTLTESEVWEVGDSLGIFFGGKAGFLQGRSWTTQVVFGLETKGAACSWLSRPGSTDTS